jgi:ABC-2 type transport system ATP-binding protein
MPPIVQVRNLRKQYDPPKGATALKGVSFTIEQGEIFSLLGPNGAGKTTLIAMLSCLLAPSGGDALIDGHSIISDQSALKKVIGVVPQEIALYPMISARENLVFWGRLYGLHGRQLKERVAALLDAFELSEHANAKVSTFSGGMKRRLNIAVGMLHQPKVLYLDEPTVGIDPQSRRRILDMVKDLNRQGMTVLYTTHYMEEAEELSDRIGIIDHGELIALGTLAELTRIAGEYSSVWLDVEKHEDNADAVLTAFSNLPQIHRAMRENGSLVLEMRDTSAALPALIACATQTGLQVRRMEIREPNLETVFLHLTGRALRD